MTKDNLCIECKKQAKHPTSRYFCLDCYEKFFPSIKEDEHKRIEADMTAEEIRRNYY